MALLIGAAGAFIAQWMVKDVISYGIEKGKEAFESSADKGYEKVHQLMLDFVHTFHSLLDYSSLKYEKLLDKTVSELDDSGQKLFAQIYSLAQTSFKSGDETIEVAFNQAKELFQTFPFVDKRPYLTSASPKFVTYSNTSSVINIKCKGNFPPIESNEHTPRLELDTKVSKPKDQTNHMVSFEVDLTELSTEERLQFKVMRGKLILPWQLPYSSYWFWSTYPQFEYPISLTLLPRSAGKVIIQYKTDAYEETVSKQTETWGITGGNYITDPSKLWHKETHIFKPEPGWTIQLTDQQMENSNLFLPQVEILHGALHHSVKAETKFVSASEIEVEAEVYCKGYSSNDALFGFGAALIHYNYIAYRKFEANTEFSEPFELQWGESKIVGSENGKTINKIRFEPFDGPPQEFTGHDITSHPYFRVTHEQGQQLKIFVKVPESY